MLCLHKLQNPRLKLRTQVGANLLRRVLIKSQIARFLLALSANILLWIISLLRNAAINDCNYSFATASLAQSSRTRERSRRISIDSSSATRKFKLVITRYSGLCKRNAGRKNRAGESAIQPHSRERSALIMNETRFTRISLYFFFFFDETDHPLSLSLPSSLLLFAVTPLCFCNSIAYNLVSRLHNNRLWLGSKILFRVLTHHLLRIRPSTISTRARANFVQNMSIRLHVGLHYARTLFQD